MKELERQQKEVEERPEKDFAEKASRNLPGLSAATLASLGGGASRRNSGDTCTSVDTEASIREMRDSLLEAEEKYKKAMVSNAQLDNEKTNFMYQVDTLKDLLLELEEQLAESQRQCEEKGKELEREKHAHSVLQFQFAEVKEALKQREEMLEKHGIILNSETATNGETSRSLVDTVHPSLACTSGEGLGTLQAPGDGAPGRASEVPWTHGSMVQVGQTEISPRTERDQPAENPGKEAHPSGDNGEGQHAPEDRGPMPESFPEHAGQATSSAGPGEPQQSPPEPKAEDPGCGMPTDSTPSSPLQPGSDLVDLGERAAGATEDQCPGLAHSPEKESKESKDMQGSFQDAQMGGGNHKEEDKEGGQKDEKPTQTRPGAPTAVPGTGEADSDPPAVKETDREMQGPQGETPDSSQKKAKNKKKKNKKKRAPAPADSGQDAEEDVAPQSSDLGAMKGQEPVGGAEQKPVPQVQNEAPHTPQPEVAAEGDESPEHSRTERGREQPQEDEAEGTPGMAEGVLDAAEGGAPQKEEEEPSEGAKGSPPGSPTSPDSGASMEQVSVEDSDLALAEEPGSCCPENSEDTKGSNGKGKGKEECSLS